MGRKKASEKLSTEIKQLIIEYYLQPNTAKNTIKKFNISRTTLAQILKDAKVLTHPKELQAEFCSATKSVNFTEEQLYQIISMYEGGYSLRAIASIYATCDSKIKQILTANNIYIRSHSEQVDLGRLRAKQTCLEKYKVANPYASESIKEKIRQTKLEKYGKADIGQFGTAEHEQAILKKYGTANISSLAKIRAKAAATCQERYGGVGFASKELLNKNKQTVYARYGCFHAPSNYFKYNGISFDSFPELCFYLYYSTKNIYIKKEPIELHYFFENKEYNYYPDFEVDSQLYEIKGDQFLKEDGTWHNPYSPTLSALYEAKHQCALKNNVKVLYMRDYKKYLDWAREHGYKKEDFIEKR